MITYRPLTSDDLPAFIALRIRQLREEGAKEQLDLAPALRDYYDRHLAEGTFAAFLALDGERAWFTVMFDETGKLLQIYADVTDGNEALSDNPTFEDMYLDYVVHEGSVYELDRDELEEAYASGRISGEQYRESLAAGARIDRKLREDREAIEAFFMEQFEKLRPELEREA